MSALTCLILVGSSVLGLLAGVALGVRYAIRRCSDSALELAKRSDYQNVRWGSVRRAMRSDYPAARATLRTQRKTAKQKLDLTGVP